MIIRILTFCFLFICYGFQCHKCEEYSNRRFIHKIEYSAFKKEYLVGEKFYIPVEFPALMNCENNVVYDNQNGHFSFSFQLLRIRDNNQDVTDGLIYFEAGDSDLTVNPSTAGARGVEAFVYLFCDGENCKGRVPIKCLVPGYYAINFIRGSFGEQGDCVDNNLEISFEGETNNFSICNEINTTRFRLNTGSFGSTFYADPGSSERMYFFKVLN